MSETLDRLNTGVKVLITCEKERLALDFASQVVRWDV